MSSKIILICFIFAFAAVAVVQSQLVYTAPYVYSPYIPYYGWVWGSNKNGGDAPMPPPPSNGNQGPGPMGPSFTNNAPRN
uniref:Uncharacterized protein n=1 Tax=Panagrolaimus davidi TaxID=227884 RepID=A0A914Q0H1_9BILA